MTLSLSPKAVLMVVACVGALAFTGCPSTGAECAPGLERCGESCIDPQSDKTHCGACGIACGALQICTEGTCGCREGTTDCNGACVVTQSDDAHCGACGNVCGEGEICADSACVAASLCGDETCGTHEVCGENETCECAEGFLRCGETCVDADTDPDHCGACGNACDDVQGCQDGACGYGLAGACGGTAQVVGLSPAGNAGPPVQVGALGLDSIGHYEGNPIAGTYGEELLQFTDQLAPVGTSLATGKGPMKVLAEPPYLYAVASLDNSLHIFEQQGGSAATGYTFASVGALNFGPHTSPQAIARIGDTLYVPLYGNLGSAEDDDGQRIAVVDISDRTQPVVTSSIDLRGLDLQPHPGATPLPTPQGIVVHGGHLYLPLNSYQASYSPGGPGLLAKVNPETGAATTVTLDPAACENVYDLASVGDMLVATCAGTTVYDAGWNTLSVDKTAVVLLDAEDAHVATYPFVCTATDCLIAKAGRMAVKGSEVYVGDEKGRVVILTVGPEGFTEVRGFSAEAPKAPLQLCPPSDDPGGFNNVADLVALP